MLRPWLGNSKFSFFDLNEVDPLVISTSLQHGTCFFSREECVYINYCLKTCIQDLDHIIPCSSNQKVIGTKWIFRIKYDVDGKVQKYKARLVAKGFLQARGIDRYKNYSPVIKAPILRTVLNLAVSNGKLEEEVCISQREVFVDKEKPHMVWNIDKALYGLIQAPRIWFEKLRQILLSWKLC